MPVRICPRQPRRSDISCSNTLRRISRAFSLKLISQSRPAGVNGEGGQKKNARKALAFFPAKSGGRKCGQEGLRAVTSISIFMRGSTKPAEIIVAAGRLSPK